MPQLDFFIGNLANLGLNLLYTLLALVLGVIALKFVDERLLKNLDIEAELGKGNLAVAIFASTILIFVAIIIAAGMGG